MGFLPHPARRRKNIDRSGCNLIYEPRGKWTDADVREVCEGARLIHGVDPFHRKPVTEGTRYYRLHGISGYYHRYSHYELQMLQPYLNERHVNYCFFNNVTMFDDAVSFEKLVNNKNLL